MGIYAKWMNEWENRLCSRATDRVVRPFEWGLEWARAWPGAERIPQNGHTPHAYLRELNEAAVARSDEFFGYETPSDFQLEANLLRFTSADGLAEVVPRLTKSAILPGCGHWIQQERPAEVTSAMLEFLAGLA